MEIMKNKSKSQLKEGGGATSSDRNDHVCFVLLLDYLHVPIDSQALGYSSLSYSYNCSQATATKSTQIVHRAGNGSRGNRGKRGRSWPPSVDIGAKMLSNLIRFHFHSVHKQRLHMHIQEISGQARPVPFSTAQASYQLSYLRLRSAEFRLLINCKYVNIY